MTSEELKKARLAMGLTQVAFSALLGIQLQKYKRWESGTSRISDEGDTLIKMIIANRMVYHNQPTQRALDAVERYDDPETWYVSEHNPLYNTQQEG